MARSTPEIHVYLGNDNSQRLVPAIDGFIKDRPQTNVEISVIDQTTGESVYSNVLHVDTRFQPWQLPPLMPTLNRGRSYTYVIVEKGETESHKLYQTTVQLHG